MPAASPAPQAVPMKDDMKIPALAEKLGLKTLVKLLGDADLVDALNGDGEPIYIVFCRAASIIHVDGDCFKCMDHFLLSLAIN